ncbi:MAG TPA: PAS domain S-box protein [bacterium]|nr:PAS domain S-box protein [bacterium]HPN45448.1 PAS domain S-box protein [bacterium]
MGNEKLPEKDQVVELETLRKRVFELEAADKVHKKREQELVTERDQLQKYLDIAGVIIIFINRDGNIELINQMGCSILGYSYEELLGKDWFSNFIPPQQQTSVLAVFHKIMKGDILPVEYYENSIVNKQGEERIIAWHNTLLKDSDGNIIGTLSSGEDITEKKLAEDAWRESEAKYRRLHETMVDAFVSIDLNGYIREYNRSYQLMLGYSVDELYKLTYNDITPEKWHVTESQIIKDEIMQRGYSNVYEKEYRRKDGTIFPVEIRSFLIRDRNSKPAGIWAIVRDITERKHAENERKAYIQFLESLEKIDRSLHTTTNLNNLLQDVLDVVLSIFKCDRAWLLFPCDPASPTWSIPMERYTAEYPSVIANGQEMPMPPGLVGLIKMALASPTPIKVTTDSCSPILAAEMAKHHIVAQMAMVIYPAVGKPWLFGLHQCSGPRNWTHQDELLFQEIGRRISSSLTIYLTFRSLHESETRFRSVFEYSAAGMILLDKYHFIMETNLAATQILGYTREELVSKSIRDITYPEDIQKTMINLSRLWSGEVNNYTLVKRYLDNKGQIVWCEIVVSSIYDADGIVIYAMGQLMDITERKKAEEEINRLARFPGENPYPVMRIDKNGIILYANNSSVPLLRHWNCKVGSRLPGELCRIVKEIAGTSIRKDVEIDAEGRKYSLTFTPIANEDYTNIYGLDVTQRNLAMEALRESEHLLLQSQKIARIGHYTFDAVNGTWTSSVTLDEIFGIDENFPKETEGWANILHPDYRDEMIHYLANKVVKEHHYFDREYKIVRINDRQERWMHGLGRLEFNDKGETLKMIGTIQDITERKLAELQVQKDLQEKNLLLKEIHHRVKNNLQIICSLLTLQAANMKNEEAKIASEISKNRIYSMALVHEQLYQSHDFSSIRIKNFITNLVRELGNVYQIHPRIKINTTISDITLGIDYAIPCGLILNELITNAIKHAFPRNRKGLITLRFTRYRNKNYILKISDNGVGLPKSLNMAEADSLGLRMVSLLVEQLEGVIETQNKDGVSIVIRFKE